jgi:hypothetical protein
VTHPLFIHCGPTQSEERKKCPQGLNVHDILRSWQIHMFTPLNKQGVLYAMALPLTIGIYDKLVITRGMFLKKIYFHVHHVVVKEKIFLILILILLFFSFLYITLVMRNPKGSHIKQ